MFILKFILWCIIQKVFSDISASIIFQIVTPKDELRFNRIKNYIPNILSYILIIYLLIKDTSNKTIFLGLLTLELIRFILKIISHKYISIINNELYLKNEKIELQNLVLDLSYRINPKCFFVNHFENDEMDISYVYMKALINNKSYIYYENDIIQGFKVLVRLENNYKFKYMYNGIYFKEVSQMLIELTKNIKEDIDYCVSKNNNCDKNLMIEKYSEIIKSICESFNLKNDEIENILKHIK